MPEIVGSYVPPPTAPGIGVEIDKAAAKHPFQQVRLVQWYHDDGSVADW